MEINEMSFEQITERINIIVGLLENTQTPLDESLSLFEEGVKLIKRANEILDNGGINWDEDYGKMAASLPAYFKTADGETAEKACALAETISSTSSKEMLYQLTELAVKWVLENNEPFALEKVNYSR